MAGLTVTVNKIGNVFMQLPGRNNALPPVVAGSHIDTQPTSGKFDGNFGVLAGLEVIRTLNDHNIETEAQIEVAFWTNEEGSRFVPVIYGLRRLPRRLHARTRLRRQGHRGQDRLRRTQEDRLCRAAKYRASIRRVPISKPTSNRDPCSKRTPRRIGVVQAVLGIRWYDCTVTSMEAHAGPTPMAVRKDALQVSTRMMQEVVALANRYQPHGRGTVGMVQVHPNSRNVIPGRVKFSIDLRNSTDALVERNGCRNTKIRRKSCRRNWSRHSPRTRLAIPGASPSTPTASPPSSALPTSSATRQCPPSQAPATMPSTSAQLSEAGMIFIPCKDGISHNEIEDTKPEEITAGCNVLLHAMLERAGVV